MASKVITVFGATGAQGSGLVRSILSDPHQRFAVRAVARRPEAAAQLRGLGAQTVVADLDDFGSVCDAMRGAWGAYGVTNFWEHFSPEREIRQAGNLARAAAREGLRHVVWSTLEDTRKYIRPDGGRMPVLMGRYNVPHLDAKGEANELFAAAGVPVTFLLTSFYWENFLQPGLAPTVDADGRLKLTLPIGEASLPGIAASDIGLCAFGVFREGEPLIGKTVGIAGEHLTGRQMAQKFSAALDRPADYAPMSFQQFRELGFPGAQDLGNMFQFKVDFERDFRAARDVGVSRRLNSALLDFGGWLARHAASFAPSAKARS